MSERPTRVKIGAHDFEVRWFDGVESDAMEKFGYCHMSNLVIGVWAQMPKSKIAGTFLHELLHAIHWVFELDQKDLEAENYAARTSMGLAMVMRDNPTLFEWLNELVRSRVDKETGE